MGQLDSNPIVILNLEFEIEKMLNERNDYNFAVDYTGNLFKNGKEVQKKEAFSTNTVAAAADTATAKIEENTTI